MNLALLKYFFFYIFKSKTRQKLLLLSIIGLVLSSFSLVIIQGVMGGLQKGLVARSKNVLSHGEIQLDSLSSKSSDYRDLILALKENSINFVPELNLEMMIQNDKYVSPVMIHGMDFSFYVPSFLKSKDREGIIIGSELGREIKTYNGSQVKIIAPGHVDFALQEIPKQGRGRISDFYSSELPEIDSLMAWVKIGFLQNIIRKRQVNNIKIFGMESFKKVKNLFDEKSIVTGRLISWEQKNQTLVWALNLETKMMLFLFFGMSILIGICITSGFLIFFDKIKTDLSSFWILGMSRKKILSLVYAYGQSLAVIFCSLGILLGLGVLALLDSNSIILMPDYFVERNIPVKIEYIQIFIAFIVPYSVASFFTHLTFSIFKKDNYSFIQLVRRVG